MIHNIGHTQLWDTVLGILTIMLLFTLKVNSNWFGCQNEMDCPFLIEFIVLQKLKYKRKILENDDSSVWKNECRKYLCLGRNAIAVIFGTLLAYILNINDIHPFTLTGELNG